MITADNANETLIRAAPLLKGFSTLVYVLELDRDSITNGNNDSASPLAYLPTWVKGKGVDKAPASTNLHFHVPFSQPVYITDSMHVRVLLAFGNVWKELSRTN